MLEQCSVSFNHFQSGIIRSMSKASLECIANDAGGDGRNGVEIGKV
jgi:hypothetical protein